MKILKYPNCKSSKHFRIKGIKGKCTCGSKTHLGGIDFETVRQFPIKK